MTEGALLREFPETPLAPTCDPIQATSSWVLSNLMCLAEQSQARTGDSWPSLLAWPLEATISTAFVDYLPNLNR